jgi:hypothetical protein
MRRAHHCWLIIIGKIKITERIKFIMALDKFNASVAALNAAADAFIADCSAHESEIAAANAARDAAVQALADADAEAAAAVDAVTAKLTPPSA